MVLVKCLSSLALHMPQTQDLCARPSCCHGNNNKADSNSGSNSSSIAVAVIVIDIRPTSSNRQVSKL